jgi:hypothetical protein
VGGDRVKEQARSQLVQSALQGKTHKYFFVSLYPMNAA